MPFALASLLNAGLLRFGCCMRTDVESDTPHKCIVRSHWTCSMFCCLEVFAATTFFTGATRYPSVMTPKDFVWWPLSWELRSNGPYTATYYRGTIVYAGTRDT